MGRHSKTQKERYQRDMHDRCDTHLDIVHANQPRSRSAAAQEGQCKRQTGNIVQNVNNGQVECPEADAHYPSDMLKGVFPSKGRSAERRCENHAKRYTHRQEEDRHMIGSHWIVHATHKNFFFVLCEQKCLPTSVVLPLRILLLSAALRTRCRTKRGWTRTPILLFVVLPHLPM